MFINAYAYTCITIIISQVLLSIFRCCSTVSFHNFKSQNFKLSVSNLKNKYVVDLSVLSQISNCQSLGRKNKHEILKTDRMYFLGSSTAIYFHIFIVIFLSIYFHMLFCLLMLFYLFLDIGVFHGLHAGREGHSDSGR